MPQIKPIVLLYCGSGFIRSLFDKLASHFAIPPIQLVSNVSAKFISSLQPGGIIISGSGSYVHDLRAEQVDKSIYNLGIPILGVCYGMQRMAVDLGGEVKKMQESERELVLLNFTEFGQTSPLYTDFADNAAPVWMAHNCKVTTVPAGFQTTGSTKQTTIASMENRERRFYGVQFHPEHSGRDISAQAGTIILWNFLKICGYDAAKILSAQQARASAG